MKVTIKGEVDIAALGEAFMDALRYCQFDKKKHYIKGATLYFNLYDAETHAMAEVWKEGRLVDEVLWMTSVERARTRLQAEQKALQAQEKAQLRATKKRGKAA
jgi:hypothetical protein